MANPARKLFSGLNFPTRVCLETGLVLDGQQSGYPHAGANMMDRGRDSLPGAGAFFLLRAGLTNPVRLYRLHIEWSGGTDGGQYLQWNVGGTLWEPSRYTPPSPWGVLDLDFAPFGLSAPQDGSTQLAFTNIALPISASWNVFYCLDSVTTAND